MVTNSWLLAERALALWAAYAHVLLKRCPFFIQQKVTRPSFDILFASSAVTRICEFFKYHSSKYHFGNHFKTIHRTVRILAFAFLLGLPPLCSQRLYDVCPWPMPMVSERCPPSVFYCPYYLLQCDKLMKHRISEDLFVTLMASTVLRCHINNYQCNWSVIGQLYHHTQFVAFTTKRTF